MDVIMMWLQVENGYYRFWVQRPLTEVWNRLQDVVFRNADHGI